MKGSERSSPISRLHEELLWMIMLENTEGHDLHRLATARYSSQVCQHWRNLNLNSSSIWGRLLDIDSLSMRPSWMQEVMARTGKAPLWITGSISIFSQLQSPEVLLAFISDHWERIEKLDVSDNLCPEHDPPTEYGSDARKQYWFNLFCRPAPLLKQFNFQYSATRGNLDGTMDDSDAWQPPSRWFNSSAPSLKTFGVNNSEVSRLFNASAPPPPSPKFTCWMPSSWLSKLRSFTLCQGCEASELMALLQMTPLLEELEITSFTNSQNYNGRPLDSQNPVCLPRLSVLRLKGWVISDIVGLLEPIFPSDKCCLSMSEPSDHFRIRIPEMQEARRAQSIVVRYLQNYCEAHTIATLSLSSNHNYIQIGEDSVGASGLSIWIPRTADNSWILSILFNSTTFLSVTTLHVGSWEGEYRVIYASPVFDSVHTLSISSRHILESMLMYLDEGHHNSFPRLHTLRLEGHRGKVRVPIRHEYRRLLYQFLRKRRDISRPVSVLDLSNLTLTSFRCDFNDFETLVGLSIILPRTLLAGDRGQESYVCGDGSPNLLCFPQRIKDDLVRPRPGRRCHLSRARRPNLVTYGWSGYI
ncbi:hypothetical protein CPC08DRAFT_707757 [Agrocybe pediades]|nr:hypothetical protein CPC08DRAFT_707757 [Agrocybe pediades]